MTGSVLLDLLISAGLVLLLIALSWRLGALKSVAVDEASATARLAFDEPDFDAAEWLIDRGASSAIALSRGGEEFALVFALGDGLATRRFKTGALGVAADGLRIVTALRDPSKWRLVIEAPDADVAARWAARLEGR
jgi:hypothetical protein